MARAAAPPAGARAIHEPFFSFDDGHPTPKVDVRAVVDDGDRILLVRERADDRWALPGGWADTGLSPARSRPRRCARRRG
jgi:ADP-ribose pyrophosphatase YjhB (NUDIX family)